MLRAQLDGRCAEHDRAGWTAHRLRFHGAGHAAAMLAGLGDGVEVVAPAAVRALLHDIGARLTAIYADPA